MVDARGVLVSELAEGPRLAGVTKRVLALAFLVMMVDNYDNTAISFAMPHLIRAWHIDKVTVGSVFTAGIFGLMVGSILFGWVGDRLGRKRALVAGLLWFGTLTLLTTLARDVPQLIILRFLAGLGIGGALPNAVALVNEYAPRRMRVFAVAAIFAGYTLGGSGGGFVSAALTPTYGWQAVFVVGGVLPLVLAAVLLVALPESVRFLAVRGAEGPRIARLVRAMRPDLPVGPDVRLLLDARDVAGARPSFADLFRGPLRLLTPTLWLLYVANSMAVFAITNWLPFLAEAGGLPPTQAALGATLWSIGGTLGGLAIARSVDRVGVRAVALALLAGCPMTASLGVWAGAGPGLLFAAIFAAGAFVVGTQNSLHGIAGALYPTGVRANGVGWALGVAKIGSISGPFAVGLLLSQGLDIRHLFLTAALPLSVGILAAFTLHRGYDRHIRATPPPAADLAPAAPAFPAVAE